MELVPGHWYWCNITKEPARLEQIEHLWDQQLAHVLGPNLQGYNVPLAEILPLTVEETGMNEIGRVQHQAIIARLDDHLRRPDSLTSHLGGTLEPLPHQVVHVEKALTENKSRLLIADEVGLGKTITAGMILTEFLNRGRVQRVLILAPSGLVPQWIQEMKSHFSHDFVAILGEFGRAATSPLVWKEHDLVITSYDSVKPIDSRKGWSSARLSKYNECRFEGLIQASWDMIVIDEAHRIAGATPGVARHALASHISTIANHLLLLTGTPHQGKPDQFHRLVELLDPRAFPDADSISPAILGDFMLRCEKRLAVDLRNEPLFVSRETSLVPIAGRRESEIELYTQMSEFIRTGFQQADEQSARGYGFLMILFQRLLSSSTAALLDSLRARLSMLSESVGSEDGDEEVELESFDDEMPRFLSVEEVLENEFDKIDSLIITGLQVEAEGPDTKATRLLELLTQIQREEKDPALKFLIFTEFKGTQKMLAKLLSDHGHSITQLNGSMGIEDRIRSQDVFRDGVQIMISTEAGGEGLNLQFCHVVINYDLPWNPMRIEQRIGRVHRIGQRHAVRAYNLVLDDTVEQRVLEILESKLGVIKDQMGIDKMSDVLDSALFEGDLQPVYRAAIAGSDDDIEAAINGVVNSFKTQLERLEKLPTLVPDSLNLEEIRQRFAKPVNEWITMISYSDGTLDRLVIPQIRERIQELRPWVESEPIPIITSKQLSPDLAGTWSLWRVVVQTNTTASRKYLPLFVDRSGSVYEAAARQIWETIIAGNFKIVGNKNNEEAKELYDQSRLQAIKRGEREYDEAKRLHESQRQAQIKRTEESYAIRTAALDRIGLPTVRHYRQKRLEDEQATWRRDMQGENQVRGTIEPILMIQLEGSQRGG